MAQPGRGVAQAAQRDVCEDDSDILISEGAQNHETAEIDDGAQRNGNQAADPAACPQQYPHGTSGSNRTPRDADPRYGSQIHPDAVVEGDQQSDLREDGDDGRRFVAVCRNEDQVHDDVETYTDHECARQITLLVDGDEHVLGDLVDTTEREEEDQQLQGDHRVGKVFASAQNEDELTSYEGRGDGDRDADQEQQAQCEDVGAQ